MKNDAQIPKVIGGYQRIRLLGRGGMGEVWLATKQGLAKPCVLKILLPELASNPRYRRRFLREAEIFAGLRHGRIVPVLDYGEDKGLLFIVMEYIDGVNLRIFCTALANDGECLPFVAIGYIAAEIFDALRHAHNRTIGGVPRGVIHRDVTPSNVLISSEGEVFLTDFGIARYEHDFSAEMLGTVGYVAPEQARGAACPQSDIYSGSGVLHFMITGEPPRQVAHHGELHAVLDDPPPPTGRADVPEPLERLRTMGLQPSLGRRTATTIDALAIVEGWDGYRRATTMLAQFYLRHIGPAKSGMTEMLPKAKGSAEEGPGGTVRLSLNNQPDPAPGMTGPSETDLTTLWSPKGNKERDRPWLRPLPDLDVPNDRRPTPPGRVEDDAPRILRRPRFANKKVDTSVPRTPMAVETTEVLPPPFGPSAPLTTERMAPPAKEDKTDEDASTSQRSPQDATSSSTGYARLVDLEPSNRPAGRRSGRGRRGPALVVIGVIGLSGALGLVVMRETSAPWRDVTAPIDEPSVRVERADDGVFVRSESIPVAMDAAELLAERHPEARTEPGPTGPQIPVVIVVGGVSEGEVQLGDQVVRLDSVAQTTVSPGIYALRWRDPHTTEWQEAGSVHVLPEDVDAGVVRVEVSATNGTQVGRAGIAGEEPSR